MHQISTANLVCLFVCLPRGEPQKVPGGTSLSGPRWLAAAQLEPNLSAQWGLGITRWALHVHQRRDEMFSRIKAESFGNIRIGYESQTRQREARGWTCARVCPALRCHCSLDARVQSRCALLPNPRVLLTLAVVPQRTHRKAVVAVPSVAPLLAQLRVGVAKSQCASSFYKALIQRVQWPPRARWLPVVLQAHRNVRFTNLFNWKMTSQ